jgi:hypothetical protein
MNRFRFLFAPLLLPVLLAGCEKDSNGPIRDPEPILSIELRATREIILGFQNEVRTDTITAIVRNENGILFQGVPVAWFIENPEDWKGTISPLDSSDTLTDSTGEARALYEVKLSRNSDVVIGAKASNAVSKRTIRLRLVEPLCRSKC